VCALHPASQPSVRPPQHRAFLVVWGLARLRPRRLPAWPQGALRGRPLPPVALVGSRSMHCCSAKEPRLCLGRMQGLRVGARHPSAHPVLVMYLDLRAVHMYSMCSPTGSVHARLGLRASLPWVIIEAACLKFWLPAA